MCHSEGWIYRLPLHGHGAYSLGVASRRDHDAPVLWRNISSRPVATNRRITVRSVVGDLSLPVDKVEEPTRGCVSDGVGRL